MTNITLSSSDTSSNLDEFPFPPYRINLDGYVELIAPRAYDRYLDDRGFHVYELHRHSDKTRRYRGSTWWLTGGRLVG